VCCNSVLVQLFHKIIEVMLSFIDLASVILHAEERSIKIFKCKGSVVKAREDVVHSNDFRGVTIIVRFVERAKSFGVYAHKVVCSRKVCF